MADYEAERVVVELLARVDKFDGTVVASTRTFEDSMDRIQTAGARAEGGVTRSFGKTADGASAASKRMKRDFVDLGDFLTSSRSPFVTPVTQAPKVAGAMKLVTAGASVLGGILGGVAAAGAAALVDRLIQLAMKSGDVSEEIDDLIDKLKEQADKSRIASAAALAFANTLDGVTIALDENEKALKQLNDANESAAQKALKNAALAKLRLQGIRDETAALVDQARAMLEVQRSRASGPGQGAELAALNLPARQSALDALEGRLGRIDGAIARADAQYGEALSRRAVEIGSRSELDAVKTRFDRLIEGARARAGLEKLTGDELKRQSAALLKQTNELRAQQKIEEDRIRARDRKPRAAASGLPKVTSAEVQALIKEVFGAGTAITSTTRSAARNKAVGGGANSYHLNGTAVDFVPQGGMKAFDKEMIRLAAEARGIKVVELLGPGDKGHNDHGHLAFSRTRQGSDQIANARERAAQKAERAAEAELNREQAFQNERASLEDGVLDARQALLSSADEIAAIELAAIELSRTKYADQVAHNVEIGKLHKDEADELIKLNEERAKLRAEAVQRRIDERNFRLREAAIQNATQVRAGAIDAEQELLQSQEGIAKTQRERAAIAQRLVDLQFAEERLMLQAAIDRESRLKAEYDRTKSEQILAELAQAEVDAALARQQLATIDQRQGAAQTGAAQSTASPLDAYFQNIRGQAADINSAFEAIAAGGLQTFEDKLTDAIVNFQSLGDVGRAVLSGITADLVRLAIRLVLNATIGKLIGSTATAATVGQATAAATAWAPAAALASLATLGANAAPAAAALATTNALALGMAAASAAGSAGAAFATGGRIYGPGTSTSDSVPIRASADEYMIRAHSARQLGYDTLDYINATGQLPMRFANGGKIRPSNARAASPGSGLAGLGQGDREFLAGEMRRAIEAMPPIQLFPTTRPEAALQQALRTPGGRRAMFDFFSDEPAAISGALGR